MKVSFWRRQRLVLPLFFGLSLTACSVFGLSDREVIGAPTLQEVEAAEALAVAVTPHSELSVEHVDSPVSFDQSPSVGGAHFPFWMNCGFYEIEVIEGAATHSMEHGIVWITYGASATNEDREVLRLLAGQDRRLLVSPYDHPEPIVASVWGAQLRSIASADSPDLRIFIDGWQDNTLLPEAGALCDGSVGIPPKVVDQFVDGEVLPLKYLDQGSGEAIER